MYKEIFLRVFLSVLCTSLLILMHETYGTRDLKYEERVDIWGVHRYRRSICHQMVCMLINTLRTGSFKLFKRPFPGFLTILTL